MTENNKAKEAYARRGAEAKSTHEKLRMFGRVPYYRDFSRNVRTFVWLKPKDKSVPVLTEQMRVYSTTTGHGTSRGLESSDLTLAMHGLTNTAREIRSWGVPFIEPKIFPEEEVLAAVNRGDNEPFKVFVHGNVAGVVWRNEAGNHDFVFKVELFVLHAPPYGLDRFFHLGQFGDVAHCYADAEMLIVNEYSRLPKKLKARTP